MLDTNASSAAVRGDPLINARLDALPPGSWCISSITAAEHLYGLAKKPEAVRLAQLVHAFLEVALVPPWDRAAGAALGPLRARLEREGQKIGDYDCLIAAHALSLNLVLVTANVREFGRVEGLRVENWQA
ncbi:type II toxin-antitoxin system VapC family toxin [Vandammella animalimorsus]|uniref:Ribonuclease VapC n=1 Tax=Vandammella animalimorsus TaxID=2029117 RepID=A0A3M6R4F7_9BURK|nr:PIN domain-containing protein [Vandammella animalimorsus]RMX10037.1 type II toxin-antitoxin system VapC family toxin [Vandammella animalimorsus]